MFSGSRGRYLASAAVVFACLAAPASARAADQEDASQEIKEALAAIKDYSVEQKDAVVAEGQELLDRIGAWTEQAGAKASDTAKEQGRATATQLHDLHDRANEQLQALQRSSAAAWDDAKRGFTDAVDALGKALDDTDDSRR